MRDTVLLMIRFTTFAVLTASFLLNAGAQEPIRPYEQNPRFWQYDGKPIILLGGSIEDNLFQIPDIEAHLDILAACGGNYVRNTMSSRDPGNIWPFAERPDGKYDLERLNDDYFRRFESLLRLARDRGIVVQVEVWDRFDFARDPWVKNPYRPANNVNYGVDDSGLQNEYPDHPGSNKNPFFRSVPALDHNERLLNYQRAQVDAMLSISLRYPNVLYCMDNETSARPEWGTYWSEHIKRKAAEVGVTVYTTEMWDSWDLKHAQHRYTLDNPEQYAFVDISQNNHNSGQDHWDNLQWVRNYLAEHPRPMNNVKIYGADTGRYGSTRDGLERFWRSLIGGAAAVRFHRPDSGIGLNEVAQAHLRSARTITKMFDFVSARPDATCELLRDREPNEAYLTLNDGRWLVYFPDGGDVVLDAPTLPERTTITWINIADGDSSAEAGAGKPLRLKVRGSGHWAAIVEAR